MSAARKMAPYARVVERQQRAGRQPNVYIFTDADAWQRAADRERSHGIGTALVLPRGADPATFAWPALHSVLVDCTDLDGQTAQRLLAALVRDGTQLVALCDAKQADRNHCVRVAS